MGDRRVSPALAFPARSLEFVSDKIAENAAFWEALAPHRPGAPLAAIRSRTVLDVHEIEAMGDVAGKRVLQLAASVGDESLQLALMGSVVTAVDIAPSHVKTGRAKAAELGVDVDFRIGDMTRLSPDLQDVDLMYVSWGGVCWVPDLHGWLRDLAERLTAGGRIVIAEHHPIWEVLTVAGPSLLRVSRSYFDQGGRQSDDPDKGPQVARTLSTTLPPSSSFVWTLGDIVTGFLDAGLVVTRLREYGDGELYPGFAESSHLPSTYIAVGVKPL